MNNSSVVVREMQAEDAFRVATIHTLAWQKAYEGIVPQDFLDAIDTQKRAENWRNGITKNDPELIRLVSVVNDEISGFCCGLENRSKDLLPSVDCELWAIYVYPGSWSQGSGSALLNAFKTRLAQQGRRKMGVWALRDNKIARRFYEKVGGRLSSVTKEVVIGGAALIEVAYEFEIFDER